jgi:hypothetical protein
MRFVAPFGWPTSKPTSVRTPEQCNHCGSRFWIEERTGGSIRKPHYSKCCALGKIHLPPICTPLEYMVILQDQQNVELCKHLHLYNVAFAFTSIRVQSVGFELGPGVCTYKVQGKFYHLIGGMEPAEGQLPRFLQAYVHDVANESSNR